MSAATFGQGRTLRRRVELRAHRPLWLTLPSGEMDATAVLFGHVFDHPREGTTLEVIAGLAKEASCVCDVGANIGAFTYVTASVVPPTTDVFAFEPISELATLIQANISANGLDNVRVVPVAVGDRTGNATLYVPYCLDRSSLHREWAANYDVAARERDVDVTSLDAFFDEKPRKPDLVKIDVEQHEPEVLAGMERLLRDQRPDLVVGLIGGVRDAGVIAPELEARYGYHVYYIQDVVERVAASRLPYMPNRFNFLFTRRSADELRSLISLPLIAA